MTNQLQVPPELKRNLAFEKERNALTSVKEDNFYDLAVNYCWELDLADDVLEDLGRMFTLLATKEFYNKQSDTNIVAVVFRYLIDTRFGTDDLDLLVGRGYSYPQVRKCLEGYLRMATTDYVKKRLLTGLDAIRKQEYKDKIGKEKAPPPLPVVAK